MVSLVLYVVAAGLLGFAAWTTAHSRRVELREKFARHLDELTIPLQARHESSARSLQQRWLTAWLWRAGIEVGAGQVVLAVVGILALAALAWRFGGPLAAALLLTLTFLAAAIVPQVKYRRRIQRLIAQVPLFIDQVIRSLSTGRNLEGAIAVAAVDLEAPLGQVIERARKAVDLGADLGESLRDAAELYAVKELHLIALAIQTSRNFGGSPREMLESVVTLIRNREQVRRELMALTGETRLSAWVFAILPLALAGYMVAVNPTYLGNMWADPSGKVALVVAVGLQAVGALMLWRMVKSI